MDGISHDVTATDKPVLYDEEGKKIISNQIEFDTASIGIYIELWKTKTVDVKLSYTGSLQRIIILFLLIMNQNRLRLQHRMICWKVWIPLH